MTPKTDSILSASRRTDIPAFYMDWFMDRIRLGYFNVVNPYTTQGKKIDVSKQTTHSIVFWSKNYDPFLEKKAGEQLEKWGFKSYFNFTINSESTLLEPNLPPLEKRLEQLSRLAEIFGPDKISWRFDPICFYTVGGAKKNNLKDFPVIAAHASKTGIQKCVTSFFDPYHKIKKRLAFWSGKGNPPIYFTDPSLDKKKQVIQKMSNVLSPLSIVLCLCCEKEVFSTLDPHTGVKENACIDGRGLKAVFGKNPEIKRDYGQRSKKGCKCTKAIDIGSYDKHPCFHNCLFCYANTDMDNTIKNKKIQ